jgi:hypothetical protein
LTASTNSKSRLKLKSSGDSLNLDIDILTNLIFENEAELLQSAEGLLSVSKARLAELGAGIKPVDSKEIRPQFVD